MAFFTRNKKYLLIHTGRDASINQLSKRHTIKRNKSRVTQKHIPKLFITNPIIQLPTYSNWKMYENKLITLETHYTRAVSVAENNVNDTQDMVY